MEDNLDDIILFFIKQNQGLQGKILHIYSVN